MTIVHSLPRTAYMKMIDVWSIFTMSIPFFEVAIHSVIDILKMHKTFAEIELGKLCLCLHSLHVFSK